MRAGSMAAPEPRAAVIHPALAPVKAAFDDASRRLHEAASGITWGDPDSLLEAIAALDAILREIEELRQGMREIMADAYLLLVEVREARDAVMRERQGMPGDAPAVPVPVVVGGRAYGRHHVRR